MTPEVLFDNSYARLPERFFTRTVPTRVAAPRLIKLNTALASELGFDPEWLAGTVGVEILAGNRIPDGAEPIATAYAGHQFGGFVPQLGDGRAILLGEVLDRTGARRDIQLKGSGPTPFSRRGDGRAALGPVLREYIVSEAMAALGIPTTRALAAVTTGEKVYREEIVPGAILTRVAASHIRVGTFQFFASRDDIEGLRILTDHVIARHYPEAASAAKPARAFLDAIIKKQAELIARWLLIGFIHGVMNTDNMSVSGETIDYGPCAFLDEYNPEAVWSAIDRQGRYAYQNQPNIGLWDLTRLAEGVLPLLSEDDGAAIAEAKEALSAYGPAFQDAHRLGLNRKLGLHTTREGDAALGQELLDAMHLNRADFTLTFRRLSDAASDVRGDGDLRSLFADRSALDAWLPRWRRRVAEENLDPVARTVAMRAVNPAYIPRNHRVEAIIRAAVDRDDF
ncbi:MAG: YdiU family protein, partial [Verrucomicrobiota bacterium]|nr:YdiU family protein [Verrucomicrobiota bacterium]